MKPVHDTPLVGNVQLAMKHIYQDSSADNLLKRSLGANTQNNNESLNSDMIWTFTPKHIYCGKSIIAMCIFIDVFFSILHIMNTLNIQI